MTTPWSLRFGASLEPHGVQFRIWAPNLRSLHVVTCGDSARVVPMLPQEDGEFAAFADGLAAGADYHFLIDGGRQLPDPVSRWQPAGVHGPSRVVDPASFPWS